jgi:transposase, IS30 family
MYARFARSSARHRQWKGVRGVASGHRPCPEGQIFFATPYHAWERGLNENINGLIRDFFPKGTDFSPIANAEVAKVERLLNARPRKSLGFRSPQEVFDPHSLLKFYALTT